MNLQLVDTRAQTHSLNIRIFFFCSKPFRLFCISWALSISKSVKMKMNLHNCMTIVCWTPLLHQIVCMLHELLCAYAREYTSLGTWKRIIIIYIFCWFFSSLVILIFFFILPSSFRNIQWLNARRWTYILSYEQQWIENKTKNNLHLFIYLFNTNTEKLGCNFSLHTL